MDLLTRETGGQPLNVDAAKQYLQRFVREDGMISLEHFCKAHAEELAADMSEPLPGFLVAALPAGEYMDSDDENVNVTDKDGDGPESTDDDEEKDTLGDMEGTKPVWSHTGGSREPSFRRRDPEKLARVDQIRSSCLTSHLVTPVFRGRKLVLDKNVTPAPPPSLGFQRRPANR
eukprot:CAMPEP_0182812024 /NCGR_PEP_ID=MMETSP0006_2-20121128/8582_1 /TAXON_ID=97485 /ORGANISM="Prymnesium parvum, Strain Texoma1" /LENGTH=173 /DNA_ID=CAMNT_0024938019 /DNA_START=260 /DNA_END=781 /DNA_ORIENTATION=-